MTFYLFFTTARQCVRMPMSIMQPRQAALGILALLLAAALLLGPFLHGFQRMETDFPNYYTAAKLTVQHMPLRQFYDWVWFQRQIQYAGIDHQLGGYIPHTPLTMLPFLPLTVFAPQLAKQIWLMLGLILLAVSILLLASLSRLSKLEVLVLSLLAYSSLGLNFQLGQYYILFLLLLVAGFYCLAASTRMLGRRTVGTDLRPETVTAPFALYFIVRRQWKALLGFLGAVAVLRLLGVALFGWSDVSYFATTVMARGLDGSVMDPYNPGLASMTAFLRRTFIPEPELNPHPMWNNPAAFFFLRTLYALGVLAISLLALAKRRLSHEAQALAWFVIVLFVLSPNEALYTFVLLLVPIALLLDGTRRIWSAILITLYVAAELPLHSWDAPLFPKVWLMLALFLFAGWTFLRQTFSRSAGRRDTRGRRRFRCRYDPEHANVSGAEAAQIMHPAVIESDGIYAASPAFGGDGWIYETIADERYLLRKSTAAGIQTYKFDGDAFHPAAARQGSEIAFELAANGRSSHQAVQSRARRNPKRASPPL